MTAIITKKGKIYFAVTIKYCNIQHHLNLELLPILIDNDSTKQHCSALKIENIDKQMKQMASFIALGYRQIPMWGVATLSHLGSLLVA